jgi:hypothetical protein
MRIAQDRGPRHARFSGAGVEVKRSAVLGRPQMFFLKINQRGEAALTPPPAKHEKVVPM